MLKIMKGLPEATKVEPIEDDTKASDDKSPDDERVEREDIEEVASGTIPKESVRYMSGESCCHCCKHFLEPNGCELVEGDIDPEGLCVLFRSGGAMTAPAVSEE